jgi:non-specific serine/threonine protein kinase/serine/threonine-protein kinase
MALRKEPERRYSSVAQFSDDIRRHLQGRPVIAHKDTVAYRTKKFVRRNRLAVAAGAVVLLAVIAGTAATAWQAQRAKAQAGVAAAERDRAQKRFNDVRQLANALLTEIAPLIERLEGATAARQALVRQSVAYLDSLAREASEDASLQTELAAAYEKVGGLQGSPQRPNLGAFSDAIASYEKAQAIRRARADRQADDVENRRLLAENIKDVAEIRFWINDFVGALRDGETSLRLYEELLARDPASLALRLGWAETNFDIAQTHSRNQRYKDAYRYLEAPIAALKELREQQDREVLRLLSRGLTILAVAHSWDDQLEAAKPEIAEAIAIGESLVAANPNDVVLRHGLWYTYLQASSLYEETGDAQNDQLSVALARKALAMIEGTIERDPANTQARQSRGQSYSKLAVSLANLNQPAEAIAAVEKALQVFADLEQREPANLTYKRNLGIAYTRLGDAKLKAGDRAGALEAFARSAASFERIVQVDPTNRVSVRDIAQACKNIGNIHRELASSDAANRDAHERAAKENYQRARVILLSLHAQGALPAFDRKFLAEMQEAVGETQPQR